MSDKPSFTQLMKMAKDMQKNMEKMQENMAHKVVSATAGTGETKVTVKINGLQVVTEIDISPATHAAGREVTAELAMSAINKALEDVRETTKGAMMDLYQQSGLDLDPSASEDK